MLLWGNSPSAHIGPHCVGLAHLPYELFCICFLVLPPAGPCDGSLLAAKPLRPTLQTCHWHVCFTLRFRFPPFPAPIPLKTTNQGGYGPPIGCTPRSCSIGGFPAAGAYSVTPPPLRPVWKERPRNTGVGLVPARGRHEPDAPDCHTHSPNFNREVTP